MVPWIAGVLFGFFFGLRFFGSEAIAVLLSLSLGCVFIILSGLSLVYAPGLSPALLSASQSPIVASALLVIALAVLHLRRDSWREALPYPAMGLYAIALILFLAINIMVMPISAWDFLSFWGVRAHDLILHIESGSAETFVYQHPHPITLVSVAAWSGLVSENGALLSSVQIIWGLFGASAGLAIWAYSHHTKCSPRISLLPTLLLLSTPLFENHLAMAGYAELPLSCLSILSIIWLLIGLQTKSKAMTMLGITLAIGATYLKNTGFFYSLAILSSFFYAVTFCWLQNQYGYSCRKITMLSFLAITGILGLAFGAMTLNGIAVTEITFASYASFTNDINLLGALKNMIFALLANASFGICVPLFMIYIGWGTARLRGRKNVDASEFFLLLLCLVYLWGALLIQLTNHGSEFGGIDNDTSYSRTLIPIFAITPILLIHILNGLNAAARR